MTKDALKHTPDLRCVMVVEVAGDVHSQHIEDEEELQVAVAQVWYIDREVLE